MTFQLTRFGYNIFSLPFIMPVMIIWFFIYYVCRLLLELATAFLLLIYNVWLTLFVFMVVVLQVVLLFIPWNDDVSWVFFDNFYTGLQVMATDYDNFIAIYPGTYFIWLMFWPFIFISQYLYYFFS